MLYTADLHEYYEDPDQFGRIQVMFNRSVRWAKPAFPFGHFGLPSKEWLEKYNKQNDVGVYVTEVDNEEYLVYVGFYFRSGKLPEEASQNYPYRRVMHLTENWKLWSDDKKDKNILTIEHVKGTKIVIDRKGSDPQFLLYDKENDMTIRMKKNKFLIKNKQFNLGKILKDFMTYYQQLTVPTGMGPSGVPTNSPQVAILAQNLSQLLETD